LLDGRRAKPGADGRRLQGMAREEASKGSDSPKRYPQGSPTEGKSSKSVKTAYRIAHHGAFGGLKV